MSANNKKQFGVWLDSRHATIVGKKNVEKGDLIILGHIKYEDHTHHSNENAAHNAEITHLHKFFKEITTHMQNAEELHITGTGVAQEQFKKYLSETPQFKNTVSKDTTTNKMNDDKLIKFFEDQFN